MNAVWIVDDDRSIRWVLEKALAREEIPYKSFGSAGEVLAALESSSQAPRVLLSDIRMPGESGLTLLSKVKARFPHMPVIIMTAYSDLDSAVAAFQGGAFEYLPKPFDVDQAVELVRRAIDESAHQAGSEEVLSAVPEILGQAPAMQEVFRAIGRLSQSHATVLINGESGSGKELVARALHRHSPRKDAPFIAINTAAIPRDLLESELFGHERGAFTGAQTMRRGRFEQAEGGTLFLDEIGDMPLSLQARLLRVLQERCVTPLGTNKSIPVDITLVCATHRRLKEEVARGGFREDLYYRLNGLCINLPSLRERSDIDSLIDKLLREEAGPDRKVQVSHKVMEAFLNYRWPGNIRQLNNVIKVAIALLDDDEESIETWHLPDDIFEEIGEIAQPCTLPQAGRAPLQADAAAPARSVATAGMGRLEEIERDMIQRTLEAENGNISSAARRLGISRNTLYRKLGRF